MAHTSLYARQFLLRVHKVEWHVLGNFGKVLGGEIISTATLVFPSCEKVDSQFLEFGQVYQHLLSFILVAMNEA